MNFVMDPTPVTIELSKDEAIVLCEFFWRFRNTNKLGFAHFAEFRALSSIESQLDHLVEPLYPNFDQLLLASRQRIAGDWKGSYPGQKIKERCE